MSFFFKAKEVPSADQIKEILSTHQKLYESNPDYLEGDYVSIKLDAQSLNSGKLRPLVGYVLKIKQDKKRRDLGESQDLVVAHLDCDKIKISNVDSRFYQKLCEEEKFPKKLVEFAQDKPIDKEVQPRTLVRPRKGLKFGLCETEFLTPCMILQCKGDKVTIIGCDEKDTEVSVTSVEWYELAPY